MTTTKALPTQKLLQHHYVRTLLASIFGIIAMVLILASILIVWLNRTLTDTSTYVQAVAPLVTKPAIRNFVADKVADNLIKQADPADMAQKLLTPDQVAGKTPEQVKNAVQAVIHDSALQVIASPSFASLWTSTNRSAHAALVSQLKTNSSTVTLDLSPMVNGITEQLKTTKLSPIAEKIELKPDSAKLNLKGGSIDKAHKLYDLLQKATLAITAFTLLMIGLTVWASVHHTKTFRRIVAGTGLVALLLAGLVLSAPPIVAANAAKNDPALQKAATAIAATLFHNLQLACVIIGVVCLGLALGSKVYGMRQVKK